MYLTKKKREGTGKEVGKQIMIMHDGKAKTEIGHHYERKGASDEWLMKTIISDIEDMGYAGDKIIIANDQEASNGVVKARTVRRMTEDNR